MIRVFITSIAQYGEREYTPYVLSGSISVNRSLNTPSICTVSMVNNDDGFVMPNQRSYIRIYSTKYEKNLFTGFLTNDPTRSFVGLGVRVPTTGHQMYQYQFQFTSDDYILNIKSVPFLPAFINQSQGYILRSIAESLCPGYFDYTYCASGDLIPYLQYDPTKSWCEYAKEFGDQSRHRYSVINKEIHYQPYGDAPLGISYDEDMGEGSFDPRSLTTSAMTTPIVNDVTVVGQQEAGNNHEDYFVGDGFTGVFPLKHKVFGLANAQQGSGILLNETWSGTSLNTQAWSSQDAGNNFLYGASNTQSLNIITGIENQPHGISYIASQNALEIAGGLSLQHGEFVFNDRSYGIIGGVFDSVVFNSFGNYSLNESNCECGFYITNSQAVQVTASGAAGVIIQPFLKGVITPTGFTVATKVNKSYVLKTDIACPKATRYTQVYRTMAGSIYQNIDQPTISGNITWTVLETDLFSGFQTTYRFSAGAILPQTAIYVFVDNYRLNLNVNSTQLTAPIPGSLNIKTQIGAGLLAPIYISGNVQYTGGFVSPSGGNLPIFPSGIGPEQTWAMSTGLRNQAAEIDSGQASDSLNFYSDALPGVGTRIRLQTWESQAALSRMRDTTSVAIEAATVGDDGVRASIVTNMNPLPRTSEDCDLAAQAFLHDRVNTFYQGTYKASWYFFNNQTSDIEFYPVCGRYFYINAPYRNIVKELFLVSSVNTVIEELAGETMTHSISFGPDLFLEKLLAAIVPTPKNVLTPLDTNTQPTVQQLSNLGTKFYSDITQSNFTSVSGGQALLNLVDPRPPLAHYEVRTSDFNWGKNTGNIVLSTNASGAYLLPRNAFDQTWYLRFVSSDPTVKPPILSRRAKILRVAAPLIPSAPTYLFGDSTQVGVDFTGDIRDVEGIEVRSADGTVTYYQGIVGTRFDMQLNLFALRGQTGPIQGIATQAPIAPAAGALGQFFLNAMPSTTRNFNVRFFNLMWEYSPDLSITINPPSKPVLSLGYRFSSALQILDTQSDVPGRTDIKKSHFEAALDPNFTQIISVIDVDGDPGSFTTNVPVTGDVYCRMVYFDYVSSGAYSNTIKAPVGNFISSSYLVGQGNVPPYVTQALLNGGIISYTSTPTSITMANQQFNIAWPDGSTTTVPASVGGPYTQILDTTVAGAVPGNSTFVVQPTGTVSFNTNQYEVNGSQIRTKGGVAAGTLTDYVIATNFGAAIPTTATIIGIKVDLNWVGQQPGTGILTGIALFYNGQQFGNAKTPNINNTSINSDIVAGSSNDKWGTSLSPAIVNSSSFGFGVQVTTQNSNGTDRTFFNKFSLTIYYSTPSGGVGAINLQPGTPYGFFPRVINIVNNTSATPTQVDFNGPYAGYTDPNEASVITQFKDGSCMLTNGPFVAQTATAGGAGGGGGGGSAAVECGVLSSMITMADETRKPLSELNIGEYVKVRSGRRVRVHSKEILMQPIHSILTERYYGTTAAPGHTLYSQQCNEWIPLARIVEDWFELEAIHSILTDDGFDEIIAVSKEVPQEVCHIHLEPDDKDNEVDDDHVYMLDGFWTHNVIIKLNAI